ncbi:MAG: hypothetical protein DWQ46_05720, partial [Planctomycetota bacterium]
MLGHNSGIVARAISKWGSLSMTLSVLPRRRWNQFRVRTLLILAALATIPFAWVGMKLRQAQRYQQAVTWLESTNGYGPDTDIDDNI